MIFVFLGKLEIGGQSQNRKLTQVFSLKLCSRQLTTKEKTI